MSNSQGNNIVVPLTSQAAAFNRSTYLVSNIRQSLKKIGDDRKIFPTDQLIYDKLNWYQDDFMTRHLTTRISLEYFVYQDIIDYPLPDFVASVVNSKLPQGGDIQFSDTTADERSFRIINIPEGSEVILTAAIKPYADEDKISAVKEPIIQKEFDLLLAAAVLSEFKGFKNLEEIDFLVSEKVRTLDGNNSRPKKFPRIRRIF